MDLVSQAPTEPLKKIPQIGNVIIEDDVDVGSCTTIDRPRIDYY
jgi:UDP-3-O-[3-hydroxymyristoyl] glucosamine N-acyltransferase